MNERDVNERIVDEDLKALRSQIAELRERKEEASKEALAALEITLEELNVTQEELREQNRTLEEAHNQLASERQRYQELFDFAPDAYLVTDKAGTVREANRAAHTLLNARSLKGKPLVIFVAENGRQAFRNWLNEIDDKNQIKEQELTLRRHDGTLFHVAVAVASVSESSQTAGLRWLLRDITRRKQAEEQIRSLNAELEQRVAERTAELEAVNKAKDELIAREQIARAGAEAANRTKDEFLATISHELRTPLTAIIGWARMMRVGRLDQDGRERALETIERNANAQAQLIEDMLDISRIVAGRLRLSTRMVEFAPIVQAAIDVIRLAAEAKGIQIEVSLAEASIILGDPDRLQQIIWNLLSNAVKFTPKGGWIKVRLERAQSQIELTVSDNGKGISPEFLPHVFERFRQADSTTTRSDLGLGLGLAIVRHLVELHGGTVGAESPGKDQGATFTLSLPLPAVVEGKIKPPQASTLERGVAALLEGVHVLVVDDEPDALELVATVLKEHGAEVTTAATAREAIAVFDRVEPNVLVSDIGMSGEDGYALIEQVRALDRERGGRIPALALTAYARAEDRTRVLAAGFQSYLRKPADPAELAAIVSRLARQIDSLG